MTWHDIPVILRIFTGHGPAEASGSAHVWASETTSTRLRRRGAVAWERSEPLGSTGPQFSFVFPWENDDFSGI